MSIEDNKAAVRRFIEEVWNKGQLALIDEFFAPDIVIHAPSVPDEITREGYKYLATQNLSAFSDLYVTIEDMIAEGDKVVMRLTFRGTNTGDIVMPMMHLPATGKQVTQTGIIIVSIVGGKAVEVWTQWDDLGMFQQLGLIPMPEPVG